ncbi:hypothetical protein AGDE_15469 [Angomonas deanei]|uniref:Uncharacterized protein n=1 Tax=Angomonas deanei TaxID=59799 RepID=A0A7G2CS24_9TRYP|nr:hypothetical protein AGDE_15469 [Angomonas deanei]CAD2222596.1 hypothetical protein, conserved [Angomonas deanei]|eukprot:EPY19010.1 hypothetical protein AGDE_15469 [Angomonas deanei]
MEEFLQRPSAEVASKYKVRQWRIQNSKNYKKIRNSRQPPAEASSKVHYVIPSEELDQRDNTFALSAIAQHGTTHTPSLRLLAEVQQEEACPDREAALRARLSPLPLSAVSECIEQFSSAAAAWHQTVLRPLTTEVREQQRQLEREQFHVLLYNVAWWQRTYPFEVVTTVLEFRRLNPSLFPPPGAVLMRLLNDMIEQVSSRLFPSLASLPWLLRCDIFMSYPQDQLKVAEAYTQAYASPEGGTRYTRADPQSVLAPYLPAEDLFPLTCRRLSHEAYRKLRTALERHKKDGVVRLCETTTKGEKK